MGVFDAPPTDAERVDAWAAPPTDAEKVKTFTPHVDPLEGVSALGRVGLGVGRGAANIAAKTTELLGHPEWAYKKYPFMNSSIGEALEGPKDESTAGKIGAGIGEAAALSPLGGISGLERAGINKLAQIGLPKMIATGTKALVPILEGVEGGAILDSKHPLRGAALGGGASGVLGVLGRVARPIVNGVSGPLSAAAKYLEDKGVELTAGMRNPGGWLQKLEDVGQHSILGGGTVTAAKQKAAQDIERAAFREALPPHMGDIPAEMDPRDALKKLYGGFNRAYEWGNGQPVANRARADIVGGFKAAASDPSAAAEQSTMDTIDRFLKDQSTIMGKARDPNSMSEAVAAARAATPTREMGPAGGFSSKAPEPVAPELTTDHLLQMRSNIRDLKREIATSPNPDIAKMKLLHNAEDVVNGHLKEALPEDIYAHIQAADQQYVPYKVMEDTVYRATNQNGHFTPAQLLQSVKAASMKGAYARGETGNLSGLQALAEASNKIYKGVPQTGVSQYVTPDKLHAIAGPVAAMANSRIGKQAIQGLTPAQLKAKALLSVLNKTLPDLGTTAPLLPLAGDGQ